MAFGRSWALWKYLGIGDIFGLGDGGYMFQLSWKIRISKHQPHAKAVPQCPSGGLELNIQLQQWQLHHLDQTWAQRMFPARQLLLFPEMMGMEGLPAILFGSEQNARGRRCLGPSEIQL